MNKNFEFLQFFMRTAKKAFVLILSLSVVISCFVPMSVVSAEEVASQTSKYDFEDVKLNYTPTFPCVADSSVVVFTDPLNASNKALLVDASKKATYYFTDVTSEFEISVDIYMDVLSKWSIRLFPDQIEDRLQFDVTGDALGNITTAGTTAGNFVAGEWFTIKIVADAVSETADVYLNDSVVASNVSYCTTGIGYGYSGGVRLCNLSSAQDIYFDNLVTPVHNEVHVEKFVPEYIKTQVLSSATPEQCGHDPENDLFYSAFPSVQKVSDERVVIVFHRGVKHAYSHGVLDCIIYNVFHHSPQEPQLLIRLLE